MKLLTKYTIKEVLGPFAAGVLFFTFIFVVQLLPEIFSLIVQNDVSPIQALEIFIYTLPFNIGFITPMSVLMATIMGFGRLSSDNEIIAMRALGANHLRIYKPIFIFGFMVFIGSFLFNNFVMTESNYRYRALIAYLVNIRPSIVLKEMEFATIPEVNISISAREVTSTNMYNVVIYDKGKGDALRRVITSETGKWINNKANSGLVTLQLKNGIVQEIIDGGAVSNDFNIFDTLNINILRDIQTKIGGHTRGLRELSSFVIFKRIERFKKDASDNYNTYLSGEIYTEYEAITNEIIKNNMSNKYETITNDLISLSTYSNNYIVENKKIIDQERVAKIKDSVPRYYYIEFNKFISIPVACFLIVLIGAPLGIIGKRTGKGLGFGVSVLVVVVYYFVITASEMVASSNEAINPNLAMWMPNIVLFVFGSFFIIRSLFSKGK